ncbi:hypothetical protein CYY_008855, partial [Polysphondylium violaceum]
MSLLNYFYSLFGAAEAAPAFVPVQPPPQSQQQQQQQQKPSLYSLAKVKKGDPKAIEQEKQLLSNPQSLKENPILLHYTEDVANWLYMTGIVLFYLTDLPLNQIFFTPSGNKLVRVDDDNIQFIDDLYQIDKSCFRPSIQNPDLSVSSPPLSSSSSSSSAPSTPPFVDNNQIELNKQQQKQPVNKPVEIKPVEIKPEPIKEQPKPIEVKPTMKVESKPVQPKPIEIKPVEQPKPVETKPVEIKPVEQPKQIEVKPVEIKPVEQPKPVEIKPVEQPKP